jgi:integrase
MVQGRVLYGYGKSEQAANEDLQGKQVAARQGRLLDPSTLTVRQQWDEWLGHKRLSLEPKTISGYDDVRKYYLPEWLLCIRLTKLASRDIKAWHAELAKRGLSPRTVYLAHTSLKAALQDAVDAEPPIIHRNPAKAVRLPKQRTTTHARQWLRPVDASKLQYALADDPHPLSAMWLLQLNTGARPGELAGLTWDNVLWDRRQIIIDKRRVEADTMSLRRGTKTGDSGIRTLTVSALCLAKLEVHRIWQEETRHALYQAARARGEKVVPLWNPLNLVFCSEAGTLHDRFNLRRALKAAMKRAGFEGASQTLTPYGIRHTAATSLGAAGVHPKQAAERLGHTPEEYLRTYSHALAELDAEAADKLDAYLERQGAS